MPHFECGAFDHSATSPGRRREDASEHGRTLAMRVLHRKCGRYGASAILGGLVARWTTPPPIPAVEEGPGELRLPGLSRGDRPSLRTGGRTRLIRIDEDWKDVSLSEVFPDVGAMSLAMRGHDWGASPLGEAHAWPEALKAPLRMMLTSRFEMWLGWGPDLAFFYNDAAIPTVC